MMVLEELLEEHPPMYAAGMGQCWMCGYECAFVIGPLMFPYEIPSMECSGCGGFTLHPKEMG